MTPATTHESRNESESARPELSPVGRHSPLEIEPERFRSAGYALIDQISDFLAGLSELPVAPKETPRALRQLIGGDHSPLPKAGADPEDLLAEAASLVLGHSTLNGHPRFFGYITSSAAPIGALADLLAAAVNPNVGAWALSPIATEIERQTIRWIAELLGVHPDTGGILVSGGNMANMVCCAAALRARAGWDVRRRGVAGGPLPVIYASAETHTWVQTTADLLGLGTDAIRWVPVTADFRMDVSALRGMIAVDRENGALPSIVVGTAGSLSTGAVDPLCELASLCRDEGIWFHVDGAYGAPAVLLPDGPHDLRALALADSVAVDPHKWLYAPLEVGCALVRDPEALRQAFSFNPPYYRFQGDVTDPPTNFYEWGPQNSRGFRALKVWLGLRQAGQQGYTRMIGEDVALARALFREVTEHPELEALTQELSVTTFRYVPAALREQLGDVETEAYLNELNVTLLGKLQQSGEFYLSNAVLGGRFALRACIVNFRTTWADMPGLVTAVVQIGRELAAPSLPVSRSEG